MGFPTAGCLFFGYPIALPYIQVQFGCFLRPVLLPPDTGYSPF